MASYLKPENVRRSVQRAAAKLDEVNPGWREKINLSELDLRSAGQCVLGQLYGHCCHAPRTVKELQAFWYDRTWYRHPEVLNDHNLSEAVWSTYTAAWTKVLAY